MAGMVLKPGLDVVEKGECEHRMEKIEVKESDVLIPGYCSVT